MCIQARNALRGKRGEKRGQGSGYDMPTNPALQQKPRYVVTLREVWTKKMGKGAVWNDRMTPYVGP